MASVARLPLCAAHRRRCIRRAGPGGDRPGAGPLRAASAAALQPDVQRPGAVELAPPRGRDRRRGRPHPTGGPILPPAGEADAGPQFRPDPRYKRLGRTARQRHGRAGPGPSAGARLFQRCGLRGLRLSLGVPQRGRADLLSAGPGQLGTGRRHRGRDRRLSVVVFGPDRMLRGRHVVDYRGSDLLGAGRAQPRDDPQPAPLGVAPGVRFPAQGRPHAPGRLRTGRPDPLRAPPRAGQGRAEDVRQAHLRPDDGVLHLAQEGDAEHGREVAGRPASDDSCPRERLWTRSTPGPAPSSAWRRSR